MIYPEKIFAGVDTIEFEAQYCIHTTLGDVLLGTCSRQLEEREEELFRSKWTY